MDISGFILLSSYYEGAPTPQAQYHFSVVASRGLNIIWQAGITHRPASSRVASLGYFTKRLDHLEMNT